MEEIEHTMPIELLLEKLGVEKVTSGIPDSILIDRLAKDGYNIPSKEKLRATFLVSVHENLMFILYCGILTSVLVELVDQGPSVSLSHLGIIAFTFVARMIDIFTAKKEKIPNLMSLVAVIRNGKSNIVDSKFLVRGDIVEVEHSMVAPADIRLIKANNLLVNGSILLGKEGIRMGDAVGGGDYLSSSNMIFQGFSIETGKGIGIVLQTGPRTVLSKSLSRPSSLSSFELKYIVVLALFWISGVLWQKYVEKVMNYQGFLVLCIVMTKFPHLVRKGRSIGLLAVSHLLISFSVFPKTVKSHEILSKIKYLIYDVRDMLVTSEKNVNKVYISDSLHDVSDLELGGDFKKLLDFTNFAVFKEKTQEVEENMSLEDWDPRPKEPEYEHPVESALRKFLEKYSLALPEHAVHYKIPLTSKNRNSLTVLTPKDQDPIAILVGEAGEILKSSKLMLLNGKNSDLPIRTISSLCEELTLAGNICIGVSYSVIDPSMIKENQELPPEVFEFSLCGIFIIQEYTENASEVFTLAQDLNITPIGIGRENKDYLLNLCYSSKLLSDPPADYKPTDSIWEKFIISPTLAAKNYKAMDKQICFIPKISVFDTAYLINQMKGDYVCYAGQNHVALQISDVAVSLVSSSKEIKKASNFVMLSNTPLVDLLKAVKALREFGNHDFFFMKECTGCLIPVIFYFIVCAYLGADMSSLGMIIVDLAIPLSFTFLWIGFPKNSYSHPFLSWCFMSLAGFYNYFMCLKTGGSYNESNYSYFFTIFIACVVKVVWLQLWNIKKQRIAWKFAYALLVAKIVFFYLYCLMKRISGVNALKAVEMSSLVPGLTFYIVSLFFIKFF